MTFTSLDPYFNIANIHNKFHEDKVEAINVKFRQLLLDKEQIQ